MKNEKKPKILVIDDETSVLEAVSRLLRNDFDVLTTVSPEMALKISHNTPEICIFLSDYRMPEMNGVEFLREIRRTHPNSVRMIFSGQIDVKEITEAINSAEIHRFILKPWDNEVLKVRMVEALQLHSNILEKDQLRKLAITDPVTHLTNHRYFQERLKREFDLSKSTGSSLALLMLDVDHFKSLNDQFGHPEGDHILASLSDLLQKLTSNHGVVSRYGGEEFAIILPGLSEKQAFELAQQIKASIETTAFTGLKGTSHQITVSIGSSESSDQVKGPGDLIEKSDQALLQAKRQGRNKVVSFQ